jgi:1A family penicillin-binding protein
MERLRKSHLLRDLLLSGIALSFILLGIFLFWASSLRIPDLSSFQERRVSQSAKIYDRSGAVLLYDLGGDTKRTVVSGDAISRNIKNATVAIEDAEFYQHHGIKPTSILRAILANIFSLNFSQGGSTITQQVVKNSLLTTDKSITRKLKEWVLAVKLDKALPKDQILEVYLNESPYGGTIYGVEEASESFFGKHASDLTLAESAYLAAIPQAPTYYSPYGNHHDALDTRKNLVLEKMLENKFISQDEYTSAKKESVTFLPQGDTSIKAPHFVFFVREYLEQKYGQEAIQNDGLKVTTTLDFDLQSKAQEIVKKYALENAKTFNASNAGLVALDPKTGQILVMVGSRDYFDKGIDGNFNITLANRQPGSAFKPFVYATAFEKGYMPDTVIFDLKTQFSTDCQPDDFSKISPCFSPDNYDNQFLGPVSFRDALAQSRNVPSVKVLYLAGITDSISTARDMGITTLENSDRYGLTLVLGGGEVTLLDLTSGYGVFANDGVRNPYVSILKVENNQGETLEEYQPNPTTVLPQNISRTISDVLSDNEARTPAFGNNSYLYFPGREVADKTGTTNNYKDAWIVGYTPSIVAGAWAGNNDNSPMEKKVAGFIVAPLWNAFMQEALKSLPVEPLLKPDPVDPSTVRPILRGIWQGGTVYTIDKFSQKLATDFTPSEAKVERAVKNIHSILFWVNRTDPNGPAPEDPTQDPQFIRWEYPVRQWVVNNHIIEEISDVIPKQYDSIHTGIGPSLSVFGITANSSYSGSSRLTIMTNSFGTYPLSRADFYLNDNFIGSASAVPFSISFVPNDTGGVEGQNTLRIVGHDSVFNKSEISIPFSIKPQS